MLLYCYINVFPVENLWKTCGKPVENLWKTCGKPVDNMWKYTFEVCEDNRFSFVDVFAPDLFAAYEQINELSDRIGMYHLIGKEKVEVQNE